MRYPDAELIAYWEAQGAVAAGLRWEVLTGGNTNALWRVGDRIVKQFREEAETPLFANNPGDEQIALRTLAGTGLAPRLIAAEGDSVVYQRVEGMGWQPEDGVEIVARALADLHGRDVPAGLPHAPMGKDKLVAKTMELGVDVPVVPDDLPPAKPVFLHGDPTAANALVHGDDVTFIDWQCPAEGDACDDLAIFLSPAMQAMSGNRPLTEDEVNGFLVAYGDDGVTARYRALAPLYAARMRGYCRWRAARGDDGYARASLLER